MTLIGATHNLSRSLGCALVGITFGRPVAACVVAGEILLFIGFKIMRNDFSYFPKGEGVVGVIVSFLARATVKIIVDFSGSLHHRHPLEMGGTTFCVSMLWAQVSESKFAKKQKIVFENILATLTHHH